MAIFTRPSSSIFWIEFVFNGKRYRQSTGTTRRLKAEAFERQFRQQVYDEIVLGRRPHEPMRFEDAVRRYVETHLKTKNRLERTVLCDTYTLAKLTRLVGAETLLDDITTARVSDLKEAVFESGKKKPATVNKYLASLRAILRMAHLEWKRLRELPRFKLYALQNERTRWLRPEEEIRLLRACGLTPHLHDLVVFLLDTGARLSEACLLTWDRVDLPKRGKGTVHLFSTKTQKSRTVPLTNRANELLRRLNAERLPDQERVFLVRTVGCHWRETVPQATPFSNPHGAWETAINAADLPDVRMHDLRHTFASRMVQRGAPLFDVSKLLGHASLKMTSRYAHLATANLKNAIAKLD